MQTMYLTGRIFALLVVWSALAPAQAGLLGDLTRFANEIANSSTVAAMEQRKGGGSAPAAGDFKGCEQFFPKGKVLDPLSIGAQWLPQPICFSNFAVLHSGKSKTPLVAVERLTREQLDRAKGVRRTDVFFEDARLPRRARSELADYRGSRYDKGHLSPAGDQPDDASMAESFALSNMVPQDPTHNREVWSRVEADTRRYVRRARGEVFVYTGPIFQGVVKTIGSGVWVPSHLFKLVFDASTGRAWAHVLPNKSDARIGPPMSYQEFVGITGWDLLGLADAAQAFGELR